MNHLTRTISFCNYGQEPPLTPLPCSAALSGRSAGPASSKTELWSRFAYVHALVRLRWPLILINEAGGEVHCGYEKGMPRRYHVQIAESLAVGGGVCGQQREADRSV